MHLPRKLSGWTAEPGRHRWPVPNPLVDPLTVVEPQLSDTSRDDLRRLRVLIPTNRDVYRLLSYGMVIDFEDGVAELTDADLVPVPLPSRRARLAAARAGKWLTRVDAPRRAYDVCLFVAMEPQWVPSLLQVRDLRRIARKVVVYVIDSWLAHLPSLRRNQRVWAEVDHLFISFDHALEAYRDALPCQVDHLPQGISDRWFSPHRTSRPLDVVSIGRRLSSVHKQLVRLARDEDLFYFYQTAHAPLAINLLENQQLLGRLLQSSKVHMNWAMESTHPERAEDGGPIVARFFESAACAGVVVGSKPRNAAFDRLFPYEGFVREIPATAPDATHEILSAALADTSGRSERLSLAHDTLSRHTWKARWRRMAEMSNL